MKYYVAAVRNWDEKRMQEAFEHCTELGTQKSFITSDYKTVKGLVRYRIQNHFLYHSHVWAVFQCIEGQPDRFLGLEYNPFDDGLKKLAAQYIRVRRRVNRYERVSGYPLAAIA